MTVMTVCALLAMLQHMRGGYQPHLRTRIRAARLLARVYRAAMTEALEFTTAKRRTEPIPFTLDGEQYGWVPPKSTVLLMPLLDPDEDTTYVKARFDYLEAGLNSYDWNRLSVEDRGAAHGFTPDAEGKFDPASVPVDPPEGWQGAQAARLEARLRDPHDDLEWVGLSEIIDALQVKVAGRPTT